MFIEIPGLLQEIARHLPPEEIAGVRGVSKQFYETAKSNLLWKVKFKRHFSHIYQKVHPKYNIDWYSKFQEAYQKEYKSLSAYNRRLFSIIKEANIERLAELKLTPEVLTASLDRLDSHGQSLLSWAQIGAQSLLNYIYQQAKYYLTKDTLDVHKKDKQGRTLLYWGIVCRQPTATLVSLMEKGQLECNYQELGYTLLMRAVQANHLSFADYLIPQFENNLKLLKHHNTGGLTVLHFAARAGNLAIVKRLIKYPELLRQTNFFDSSTPLQLAAREGHLEVVKLIIENNSDLLNITNQNSDTLLHSATLKGHLEIVQLLLKNNPDLLNKTNNQKNNVLHVAVEAGHLEIVKFLFKLNPDLLNKTNNQKNNVFHLAASGGHLEVIRFLFKLNPYLLNKTNNEKNNVLHLAASGGHLEVVKFIIKKGPHLVDNTNIYGNNALDYAASKGHLKIVELLVEGHPHLLKETNKKTGDSALHLAAKSRSNVMQALIERYPLLPLDQVNYWGDTPLQLAKKYGSLNELQIARYELLSYITRSEKDTEYKTTFKFFWVALKWGFSKTDKLKAASALKEVMWGNADEATLKKHQRALENGKLKSIYHCLKPYLPSNNKVFDNSNNQPHTQKRS